MKKKLLYIFFISLLLLSGCEKKSTKIAPASLFVLDGNVTSEGIRPGDGPDAFKKAYRSYTLQVAWTDVDSNYMVMSPDEIPYDENISTIITSLFINGKPVTEAQVCSDNDIEGDALYTLLSSPDYLRKHEVIYRYLDFDWKNGLIADISSEELNYNETFETPCLG